MFSIIIPALNEGRNIERCIGGVRDLASDAEVIVADGGSEDDTAARALAAGAVVCHAERGRGTQLHAGAQQANGDILVFLHADTMLPPSAFALVRAAFSDQHTQLCTFRLSFSSAHWLLGIYSPLSRFDSILTTFGDQCIVVRSRFYKELGGFPPWPLFEDVGLLQEARRRTRIKKLRAAVRTSPRRYQKDGVLLRSLHNGYLVLRFLLGASPYNLAVRYEHNRHRP